MSFQAEKWQEYAIHSLALMSQKQQAAVFPLSLALFIHIKVSLPLR